MAMGLWAEAAAQEPNQDLALFFSVAQSNYSGIPDDRFEEFEFTPTVDAIFSRSSGKRRLMAEFLVNDEEQELERFHYGWQLSEDTRLLLGRFHHSATFWNTQYHHGAYMQTAIVRPSIEEFEDFGGILPMHVTGILIDQRETFDAGTALEMSFSAGLSARLDGNSLEAFNLLDPRSGFEPGINARLAFFPDALGENQIGLSLGKHNVQVDDSTPVDGFWDPTANEIELETFGLHASWSRGRWRLLASSTSVSAAARGGVDDSNRDFVASYLQTELDINATIGIHVRAENTTGDESYSSLFTRYTRRQLVGGVRWEVADNHALTFELADGVSQDDDFRRASIQWSFVLQ
jgi:hypothetical protein